MRTAAISFVSFLLGVLTSLGSGHHLASKSVFAQMSTVGFAPFVPPLGGAVPKLQPSTIYMAHNTSIGAGPAIYNLDGMVMENNLFANSQGVTLIYGGGAFKLSHVVFSGKVGLELTGAAANTASLLASLGFLRGTEPQVALVEPPATDKNKPIIKKTTLKAPLKGDISSQFDGTQQ